MALLEISPFVQIRFPRFSHGMVRIKIFKKYYCNFVLKVQIIFSIKI